MTPLRTAFVMEQALGHVTHYQNLRAFIDRQPDCAPVWLRIPFEVRGAAQLVPGLRNNWSIRASWRARRALGATRARGPLDAVVFHTQVTSLFSVGIMRDVPSVISLDATPVNFDTVGEHYGHHAAGVGFLDRQKHHLNQRAFHAAAGLVTWSEWARKSLIQDYAVDGSRVRVLPPGAGQMYFEIGRARSSALHQVRQPRVRLLFVGGDFRRKGGPSLLDCMHGPLGDLCELHLVTQADVPAQPNVVVHRGLQPNSPALQRLFAEADIFVLPTQADCLAVVLAEAAAAGLPIITTDLGALGEAVQHGDSGLLLPPADTRALQLALTELVNDPQRRQRMGRAGYALARQRFDSQANNRALLDMIRELVEARQVSGRAA